MIVRATTCTPKRSALPPAWQVVGKLCKNTFPTSLILIFDAVGPHTPLRKRRVRIALHRNAMQLMKEHGEQCQVDGMP